jgi:endonuclease YncB( thermonuclease family)
LRQGRRSHGLTHYPTPHLFGTVEYRASDRLRPDGDTIHLRDPALLLGGRRTRPEAGALEVWMPGHARPRLLELKGGDADTGDAGQLTIRLSGIDAPESHYIASTRPEPTAPALEMRKERHKIVCQPHARAPVGYLMRAIARARGRVVIEIDRDVADAHGRVLGFVWSANEAAEKKTFLTLELVRRGLAFPFVFESAADHRPRLLEAGARAKREKRGVWNSYVDKPLAYERAAHLAADVATRKRGEAGGELNLPVVFRRVVECAQLKGLRLEKALRKYDVFDDVNGDLVPGDEYRRIAVERRVWAPHRA